jgi:hypothetical protein
MMRLLNHHPGLELLITLQVTRFVTCIVEHGGITEDTYHIVYLVFILLRVNVA